ncbi:sigma 54-interacting transcriptional regulator [Alkalibacillus haloalkaliphilus]|uniref:Putative sigma L-dependent transcriptional regulator YqiR n=1 Tax=Alkalibacillus haloalkaliphilus TaxID=94136 RepID=A0A511W2G7_9BACI|nr:sigma 54-interacting transcriptional regulator [Alkalibacillus haloalkaliphilus]GEN45266.1 putative sigma L-dependent transcriptional regulator YqiR [Alkalibacillus haloalkaliphilus]
MQNVLIVGAGQGGTAILKLFEQTDMINVQAVADINQLAPGIELAANKSINTYESYIDALNEPIDIIVETTGKEEVFNDLKNYKTRRSVLIPGTVAHVIYNLLNEKESLLDQLKKETDSRDLLLNSIHDGMIVIDLDHNITYVNEAAENILNLNRDEMVGHLVTEIISDSHLPNVMKTRKKELNQPLNLSNGKRIITTRIPLVTEQGELLGAFAVFKDITEVVELAEEITDLKNIQNMLEAIIQSSEEAISVVDEYGRGLLINPAYTKITGLKESEIIGKPATADISEGESMHMQVLETRRPVRGARMKVGPLKRDVLVNAAPILVDGVLKGSVAIIHDLSEIESLTSELKKARQIIRNLEAKYTFDDIIAQSTEMKLTLEQAKVGAKTPVTVLLRGESGTGKELIAHAIHNESDRKHYKFIRVNCASMEEEALEKALFGDETGPPEKQKGLFEEANNGSLFLDEIGDLSVDLQARVLHVLENQEIIRVGGRKPIPVNVRVIAATNVNLERAMMEKEFREDLFYRLNRLPIMIAPLRERTDDIEPLTQHLITKLNEDYGRNVKGVNVKALGILKEYDFPGNVRELENILGRAIISMEQNESYIKDKHLPSLRKHSFKDLDLFNEPVSTEVIPLQDALDEFEKQLILETLEKNNYIKSKTAKQLNISLRNLYYKMEKHNLGKDVQS